MKGVGLVKRRGAKKEWGNMGGLLVMTNKERVSSGLTEVISKGVN